MSNIEKLEATNARLTEILAAILDRETTGIPLYILKRARSTVKASRARRHSKVSSSDVGKARSMRAQGKSISEIALVIGRSYTSTRSLMSRAGIKAPGRIALAGITQKTIDDALMMRANGYQWKECAEALDCDWERLGDACRAYDKKASKRGSET